jgi:hypothetical protein
MMCNSLDKEDDSESEIGTWVLSSYLIGSRGIL